METVFSSSSLLNDLSLQFFMQSLQQISSQQPQNQEQQQTNETPTLEQILQNISMFQAIQELAIQQQNNNNISQDQLMNNDNQKAQTELDFLLKNLQQQDMNIQNMTGQQQSVSSQMLSCNYNLLSQLSNNNKLQDNPEVMNNIMNLINSKTQCKQYDQVKNEEKKNAQISPSISFINLPQSIENTFQTSKGRDKRDSISTIYSKQQSFSQIEAASTPCTLPLIPEIIIPTPSQTKSCSNYNIPHLNLNQNNNNHSSNYSFNNIEIDSQNNCKSLNSLNKINKTFKNNEINSKDNNNSKLEISNSVNQVNGCLSDEIQMMNFLTSNPTVEQLLFQALNGDNTDNMDSISAILSLMQGNNCINANQFSSIFEGQNNDMINNNNKMGDNISQQQLSNITSENLNFRNNAYNSSISNSAQNSKSGSYSYQQKCSNSNTDQNILKNISTNLNSFFEKSFFNSEEKQNLSPPSSLNQISSFIPQIISNNKDNLSENINLLQLQQYFPEQQLDFSQMQNILGSIDPMLQSLIPQYVGTEANDCIRLTLQKRLERQIKIERYKNKRRNWIRKISYDCRKRVADSRLRVKGRFISKKDCEKLKLKNDDSSCHQENTMAIEQQTQIESAIKHDIQNSQDNYMSQDGNLNTSAHTQFHSNNDDLQQPNLNDKNQRNIDQEQFKQYNSLENQNSFNDLTCASAFNNNIMNPSMMEKVKKRINNKKNLFSLINSNKLSQIKTENQSLQNIPLCMSQNSTSSSRSVSSQPISM